MPVQDRFDLVRWIDEFPLARLRSDAADFVHKRRARVPEQYPDDAAVEQHIRRSPGCR